MKERDTERTEYCSALAIAGQGMEPGHSGSRESFYITIILSFQFTKLFSKNELTIH